MDGGMQDFIRYHRLPNKNNQQAKELVNSVVICLHMHYMVHRPIQSHHHILRTHQIYIVNIMYIVLK